jgi:hypothetical protein
MTGPPFDHDALRVMHKILDEELAVVELPETFASPLSSWAKEALRDGETPEHGRVYIDAYLDLFRLLEEMRFETALALLLMMDHGAKMQKGEAPPFPDQERVIPAEALALLLRFMREPPRPDRLFTDRLASMSGSRILADWFAAQLIDGVLFRAVAACDRLAIMLWTRARVPLVGKQGRERHPAFRGFWLDQLADIYQASEHWPELRGFADRNEFARAKEIRDGFTHRRRRPSQLHGEMLVTFAGDKTVTLGMDGEEHLALAFQAYNEIVRPLVGLTGQVLPTADTDTAT